MGGLDAGVTGFDDGGDAAARAEVAYYVGPDGVAGFDDIVEDLVDDVFLEDAVIGRRIGNLTLMTFDGAAPPCCLMMYRIRFAAEAEDRGTAFQSGPASTGRGP